MMISPSSYIDRFKEVEYLDLIKERGYLMKFIIEFEEKDIAGDRSGEEWGIYPQPDVQYQIYLKYLGELCDLMSERYNQDYVWGDRTLRQDAKDKKEV